MSAVGHFSAVALHYVSDGVRGMSLREAHRVMDEIESRLRAEFPDVEIIIHPDPEDLVGVDAQASQEILPH